VCIAHCYLFINVCHGTEYLQLGYVFLSTLFMINIPMGRLDFWGTAIYRAAVARKILRSDSVLVPQGPDLRGPIFTTVIRARTDLLKLCNDVSFRIISIGRIA
jgi:hypothetical protein